ncbi:SDR family oxidoreductase [Spirosoma koreense]
MEGKKKIVLVTGGSGFIASHCIIQLLQAGYQVRATLRSLTRSADVRAMLKVGGIDSFEALTFVEADLSSDRGWAEAVSGCSYVLHVASPTPTVQTTNEDDFIRPAREGVLRVLRTARDAGVERVVLTSAFGAVGYGSSKTTPYTEADWTDLSQDVPPYQKSKTLAEQAAWAFIANEGHGMELSTVNPMGVLGPVLSADYSHSIQVIHRMLNGELAGCPKIRSGYVDVRDVADLHLKAMTSPEAKGERFIAVAGKSISMLDMANLLRSHLGKRAANVPTRELPNWLIRIVGRFNPQVRLIVPHLGLTKQASHEKASRLLNWQPRSNEEAVLATAESLLSLGLVK